MATRTLQIGVIGIGWYAGTALIPQLRAAGRAEIVAIARRSVERLTLAQKELRLSRFYREMLLADCQIRRPTPGFGNPGRAYSRPRLESRN